MRITLHLLFPSDDSHMLPDSPVEPQPASNGWSSTATRRQSRGTDGFLVATRPCSERRRKSRRRSRRCHEDSQKEKATCASGKSLCFFACRTLCEKRRVMEKKNRDTVQEETRIQRASVRSRRLSITADSQGPFRAPVNHSPALPAHEAAGSRDQPTAELHPVLAPPPPQSDPSTLSSERCPVETGPRWPLFTPGGSCLSRQLDSARMRD